MEHERLTSTVLRAHSFDAFEDDNALYQSFTSTGTGRLNDLSLERPFARAELGSAQLFKSLYINGSLRIATQTGVVSEALQAVGLTTRWSLV